MGQLFSVLCSLFWNPNKEYKIVMVREPGHNAALVPVVGCPGAPLVPCLSASWPDARCGAGGPGLRWEDHDPVQTAPGRGCKDPADGGVER